MPQQIHTQVVKIGPNGPFLEILPNSGAGCMLFYPGTMMAPGHYGVLLASLRKAGLAVAGLHLSGHGFAKKTKNFTFKSLLEEGLQAEKWLLKNGFGPVAVCGHSQGGIMALAHGAESKSCKAIFAISGVFPQMDEAIQLTRFARFSNCRQKILAIFKRLARLWPGLPLPLPLYLPMLKILSGQRKPVIVGKAKNRVCYPASYLYSLFSTAISTKINCDAWLISASNDALFTKELITQTFAKIDAPYKELLWLSDGGHLAPLNPGLADNLARNIACACAGININLNIVKDQQINFSQMKKG